MIEDVRRRARAVFGESAACGYVLGGCAAAASVVVAGSLAGTANVGVLLLYGGLCAGIGGGIGLVVGTVAGGVLYALVRGGESRLGTRAVARLMTPAALVVTVTPALAIGALGSTAWLAAVCSVVGILTVVGARVIARRYLRRAEAAHLH